MLTKAKYIYTFYVWHDIDRLETMLTNYGVMAALLSAITFASLTSVGQEDFTSYAQWHGLPLEECSALAAKSCGTDAEWMDRCTAVVPQPSWDNRVASVDNNAAVSDVTFFVCCKDAVRCAINHSDVLRHSFFLVNTVSTVLLLVVVLISFQAYVAVQAATIDKENAEEVKMLTDRLKPTLIFMQLLFLVSIIAFCVGTYWLIKLKSFGGESSARSHTVGPLSPLSPHHYPDSKATRAWRLKTKRHPEFK